MVRTCAEKNELREVANSLARSSIVSKAETLSLINCMEREAKIRNCNWQATSMVKPLCDVSPSHRKGYVNVLKKTLFPLLFIDKTVPTLMKLSYFLGLEYKKKQPKTTSMKLSSLC